MRISVQTMAVTALATAVICVLSPFTILLPVSPVPVSLSIFAIYIAVYAVGMKWGLCATALYLLIGLVGVPVFSSFSGGAGKLFGPTGGYLIGYLLVALLAGLFIDKWENRGLHVVGMILGTAACYLLGTLWLSVSAHLGIKVALAAGVIPFLPADAVKIAVAVLIGPKLRRALMKKR